MCKPLTTIPQTSACFGHEGTRKRANRNLRRKAVCMLLKEEHMGYQPGSNGGEDSDSMDGPHSPGHAEHHPSSRCCHQSSVSWMDQCPSKGKDQHMPEDATDTSCKATEESEGEEQSTPLTSLEDEHELMEGSTVSGQESLDVTSTRGDSPSDSQTEVIVHTKEEEINSLC